MNRWVGIAMTVAIVIVALVIYNKWVAGKVSGT